MITSGSREEAASKSGGTESTSIQCSRTISSYPQNLMANAERSGTWKEGRLGIHYILMSARGSREEAYPPVASQCVIPPPGSLQSVFFSLTIGDFDVSKVAVGCSSLLVSGNHSTKQCTKRLNSLNESSCHTRLQRGTGHVPTCPSNMQSVVQDGTTTKYSLLMQDTVLDKTFSQTSRLG